MRLETMKIKHPDGFAIINVSDFDEAVHEPFDGSGKASERAADTSDAFDELSDEQLADIYLANTDKEPDGRWKRDRLITELRKLNEAS